MADPRHKRDTPARPRLRVTIAASSIAVAVTASTVATGVTMAPRTAPAVSAAVDPAPGPRASPTFERQRVVSRAETRRSAPSFGAERLLSAAATRRAVLEADAKRWTTELLNVWTQPGDRGRKVGLLDAVSNVVVTGRSMGGRDEVVVDGRSRWVTSGYLARRKPQPTIAPDEPTLGGTCSNGTSVPAGVSANIVAVHAAVCAAFPEITTYGTLRGDGEHAQGIAVDIMVSGARGWQVAEFVRQNYSALGVSYAIHARNIWSVQRAGEGWRGMEDRGSTTANHYDHVHVTTF